MEKGRNIIYVIILLLCIVLFLMIEDGFNDILVWSSLFLFYQIFYKSVRSPKKITIVNGKTIQTFLKIDIFFYLFFYIIYYYPYQMHALGLNNLSVSKISYDAMFRNSNKAVVLANIGLLCFYLGYNLGHKKNKESVGVVRKEYLDRLAIFSLSAIILVIVLLSTTDFEKLLLGAYMGSTMGDITSDAIFSIVTFFVIFGLGQVIAYYFLRKKIPMVNKIILLISVVWSISLLIIGDRNTFFIIGIVGMGGVFTFIKGISKLKLLALIYFAFFISQIIGISRVSEEKSFEGFIEAFLNTNSKNDDDNSILDSFDITSASLRHTFEIVPLKKDYYQGKFKLISLTSIIPYSSRLFVEKDDFYTGSSAVIKEEMIGKFAFWGTGTNIISDAYLDFGIFGVLFILFIIGMFGGYVNNKITYNMGDPKWIVLYLITLGYYSEISRYGFDFPVRSVVWTFLIFYIIDNSKIKKFSLT